MTAAWAAVLAGESPSGLFAWRGERSRDLVGEAWSAGWVVREIDSTDLNGADELYDRIAVAWSLPDWFGRNLDALWDVLGDLAASPVLVVWNGYVSLADRDPQLAQILLELFRDACTQASAMSVVVIDAPAIIDLDALL